MKLTVSVVIPNYNGARLLPTCLEALREQTFRDFETIVVDNASTDDSVSLLRTRYPEVLVIEMSENRVFAGAVNAGIRRAGGDVIATLNNDTEADPRWIEELCLALERHPEASFAASKIVLFDRRDVLNSAGDLYGIDGVPGNRGVWEEDSGQYDREELVFGACAGAAAYRRIMLDDVGLFDEDLVAYCEDVDLNLRAQLRGHKCVYVPTANVSHRLSATGGGPLASFYCGRNFINVMIKNMPGPLIRKHWRAVLAAQLGFVWQSVTHFREPAARARLKGQLAAILQLRMMLRKRSVIQGTRRATDEYLESILTIPCSRRPLHREHLDRNARVRASSRRSRLRRKP
ncbi:MAG: glycosyltransferase family 2 protein [Chloroflexi bacterium]|nr:glycosyltransferase family 2 protein [Chloroflexota bacterium]